MKHIAATVLIFLIALSVHAGEACDSCGIPLTIDAQEGGVTYMSAGPKEVEATTKLFSVPSGYRMIEVAQPDKVVCSAYPQESIWSMVAIKPVSTVVKVGTDNVNRISIIEGL